MNREIWDDIIKNGAFSQELDWFAIDNKGHLGVFTAIMNAPVPEKLKESYENYKTIKDQVDSLDKTTSSILITKQKRNFKDWMDYADKGLFAYDFQDIHRTKEKRQYDLIASPIRPLTVDQLHLPAMLVDSLIKIDCDFREGDISTDKVK